MGQGLDLSRRVRILKKSSSWKRVYFQPWVFSSVLRSHEVTPFLELFKSALRLVFICISSRVRQHHHIRVADAEEIIIITEC